MPAPEPTPFSLSLGGTSLTGEEVGEGRDVVCVHGLTATRRYVVHGSKLLTRRECRLVSYDARGHGESDPAPAEGGYTYPELAGDLAAVLSDRSEGPAVLAGHSMGAHTIARLLLDDSGRASAAVFIGPTWTGEGGREERLDYWDSLADGLEERGPEGFVDALLADGTHPDWTGTIARIARERISAHRHPEAIVRALREVPRSVPFSSLDDLASIQVPALVVGSHDEADPGHPLADAQAWAEALPGGELISEEPGESPLAWQGGRLSRAIADFLDAHA